jgi:hypothetical protein
MDAFHIFTAREAPRAAMAQAFDRIIAART